MIKWRMRQDKVWLIGWFCVGRLLAVPWFSISRESLGKTHYFFVQQPLISVFHKMHAWKRQMRPLTHQSLSVFVSARCAHDHNRSLHKYITEQQATFKCKIQTRRHHNTGECSEKEKVSLRSSSDTRDDGESWESKTTLHMICYSVRCIVFLCSFVVSRGPRLRLHSHWRPKQCSSSQLVYSSAKNFSFRPRAHPHPCNPHSVVLHYLLFPSKWRS